MTYQRPISVEEICNKLRPIYGKKIDEIYLKYSMAESRDEQEEIAHMLNAVYNKNLARLLDTGILLEPPQKEIIEAKYPLAKITYAGKELYDFALREHDWPRHVCITGMSGSGKTTFAFNILQNFIKENKAFLVFDWKKSFRPLIKASSEIQYITVGDDSVANLLKMNINVPPKGISPKEWINVLCDLLVESFSASFGVHKVLLETLDESFKEWGIYHGSENYPTWNHIKWRLEQKLDKVKGREEGWIESALRIATVLTFGDFGKVLNYKGDNALRIEDVLNKKIIMEMNSLGNIEKKFFCEFVLTYIYKMKKAMPNSINHKFDHAIVVDEAHNIFLKKPTSFANESVTDMIYREMREYGTSLICLDQHISKISDTVKGNSACHVAFQQQLPQDIFEISDLMQIKEKKHYFNQLPVGQAIVKLSERYTAPFLVNVHLAEIRKEEISDADLRGRMQATEMQTDFENGTDPEFNKEITDEKHIIEEKNEPEKPQMTLIEGFSPMQQALYEFTKKGLESGNTLDEIEKALEENPQRNYRISDIVKVINYAFGETLKQKREIVKAPTKVVKKTETEIKKVQKTEKPNSDEEKILNFLRENPNHELSVVEIYKTVGLSARKGTKIKKELEEKGIIKTEEVKYAKGWKKFMRLNHTYTSNTPQTSPQI